MRRPVLSDRKRMNVVCDDLSRNNRHSGNKLAADHPQIPSIGLTLSCAYRGQLEKSILHDVLLDNSDLQAILSG